MSATPSLPSRALARAAYREIPLYGGVPEQPCEIDLSDNTNQWGMPPAARRALETFDAAAVARYPAAYTPELVRAIAQYAGVSPDMVVTGCGSDQVLDCAFRAIAEPGDRIAYADPTFVIVPSFARANSLVPVGVPWVVGDDRSLTIDDDALRSTGARLIYLCSPNNPTGTVVPPETIRRIVERAPGIVIVDEAYFEYGAWTAASLLAGAPNLLVTRTFSKAFGLAGLRIGYALGDPALVQAIAKARGPYALGAYGEPAGIAALRDGLEWMQAHVAVAGEVRASLSQHLAGMGWTVYDSGANFVLAAPNQAGASAMAIARSLRAQGIAVRSFSSLRGIGGALRITVAPWPMMERLLSALQAVEDDA